MLAVLLLGHLVAGLIVLCFADRLGRRGLVLGGLAPAATALWAASQQGAVLDGDQVVQRVGWVPALDLSLDLRFDQFALLMVVLVSGIGTLVFIYAWSYFGSSPKAGRAAGLLTLFAGAMLGVILADNLLALYVFWELTSVTSFLLIGLDDDKPEARSAAIQALVITGLGGLAMLAGFVLVGLEAGTFVLAELAAAPPQGPAVEVGLVLILIGAFTKSAQYPFHSWLPGAMVAPTPISAYLHSAAMVKAGIYLVARLAPGFAAIGPWRPLVVAVGLTTMIVGGLRALRAFDLKQLLAFGTISQLGFLMVLFGVGRPEATTAGAALLLAHALFKAPLFMVVGIIDHEVHTRDIRTLPALGRRWRPTLVVGVISAASMAAIPPLAGFVAKEKAYAALVGGGLGDRLTLAGLVAGSMLTVAYSARFALALVRPALLVDQGLEPSTPAPVAPPPPGAATSDASGAATGDTSGAATGGMVEAGPGWLFLAPAAVLAVGSVVLGLWPVPWSALVRAAAERLDPDATSYLTLWHGFTAELVLSALTVAAGAGLVLARHRVARFQARLAPAIDGSQIYDRSVRSVLRLAARVTAVTQSGSLPVYAAVVLVSASVVPMVALARGPGWPGWPALADRWIHLPIAALLMAAALATVVAGRRFAAALLLGLVGFGMSMLFVVQGAPDLALTQFAIETLSMVVFLLVLRRLPDTFERPLTGLGRSYRLAVSAVVGVSVAVLAVASAGARSAVPVSEAMLERTLPEGYGRNVVNVILVDIRGLDTLGEVTVLVTAALGITALARRGRPVTPTDSPAPGTVGATVTDAVEAEAMVGGGPVRRSLIFDTTVRLVFDVALVLSIYLLFAGHNQPGGGFVGGLVAASAVALRYVAGGMTDVWKLWSIRPWMVLSAGLAIAAGAALVPVLAGRGPLDQGAYERSLALLGSVKFTSATVFDTGVYLIVVGLMLMILEGLGERAPLAAPTTAGAEGRP